MANLGGTFNAANVEPAQSFTPIPNDVYLMHIIESDVKPTSDGTGQYIAVTLEVLDGQYKGRRVFDNLNIANKSQQAEQIGQRQLSALCHAAGVLQLADTSQLHHKPMRVRVAIKPAEQRNGRQYDERNVTKGYEAVTAGATPAAPAAPTAQPAAFTATAAAAPANAAKSPPWASKAA